MRELLEKKELDEEKTWTQEDDVICNATLEATLLHARNLYDFFAKGPYKDDMRAAHFLPNPEWRSSKLNLLGSRQTVINYGLSHLTHRRVSEVKADWNDLGLLKIADEMNAAFHEFIDLLPENEQSRWAPARTRHEIYKSEETSVNTDRNSHPPITTVTSNYTLSPKPL